MRAVHAEGIQMLSVRVFARARECLYGTASPFKIYDDKSWESWMSFPNLA